MIDPTKMTEYGASVGRLEEIALFSVLAASNNALSAARGLERLLNMLCRESGCTRRRSPFGIIRLWCKMHHKDSAARMANRLKKCGIGKFTRKGQAVVDLAFKGLDLRTCTQEQLETVYNIGFKTSRFFILHTRPEANTVDNVALDTHMMSFLQDQGYDVPDDTPGSKKEYDRVAKLFFKHAVKSGKPLAQFDLDVWNEYSGHQRRK